MGTGASCTRPAAVASARGADHTAADPQVTARTMQMNAFFMKLQTAGTSLLLQRRLPPSV